jgi:hypothetical protein
MLKATAAFLWIFLCLGARAEDVVASHELEFRVDPNLIYLKEELANPAALILLGRASQSVPHGHPFRGLRLNDEGALTADAIGRTGVVTGVRVLVEKSDQKSIRIQGSAVITILGFKYNFSDVLEVKIDRLAEGIVVARVNLPSRLVDFLKPRAQNFIDRMFEPSLVLKMKSVKESSLHAGGVAYIVSLAQKEKWSAVSSPLCEPGIAPSRFQSIQSLFIAFVWVILLPMVFVFQFIRRYRSANSR